MSVEEELKEINKKMLIANVLGAPGTILFGLGLYGKFGAQGSAFIELLNNETVVYGCLAVGGFIMLLEAVYMVSLLRRRARLAQRQ